MTSSFAASLRLALPFAACVGLLPAQGGQPALLPPTLAQAFAVQAGTLQSLTLPAAPIGLVTVPVVFAGAPALLELAPFDVRAANFQLWVRSGDQLTEVSPPPAANTWRGGIAGEVGSAVAATIDGGGLTAYVRRGSGDVWVVQPLRAVSATAPATSRPWSPPHRALAPPRAPPRRGLHLESKGAAPCSSFVSDGSTMTRGPFRVKASRARGGRRGRGAPR
jgi:hypothetical protein